MKNFKKKYSIKVPKNIQVIYCSQKNLITFVGPLVKKSLKLKIKLFLIPSSNLIIARQVLINDQLAVRAKDIKKIQGTTIARIRQILIEVTYTLYQKLNLSSLLTRA